MQEENRPFELVSDYQPTGDQPQAIHFIMMICCIHRESSYLRPTPLRRNERKKKTGIR